MIGASTSFIRSGDARGAVYATVSLKTCSARDAMQNARLRPIIETLT